MFGADAAGAKRLIPEAWRRHKEFDNIHKLDGVAVITVQLRYNGWITEMQDSEKARTTSQVRLCMPFVSCVSLQYQLHPFKYTVIVNQRKIKMRHKSAALVSFLLSAMCMSLPLRIVSPVWCSAPLGLLVWH